MMNLFSRRPKPDLDATTQLKDWVRELFQLTEEATVMVTELRCQEDDCPDVETVIAVFGGPGEARKHKVFKPIAAVTREDVRDLAARGSHG